MAEYRFEPVDHDPFAGHLATLSGIGEALTPEWAKPFAGMSSEQANREAQILASGKQAPGKIGPGYLSDTQRLGSAAGDILSLLAPEGAALGMAVPWGAADLAKLTKLVRAGRTTGKDIAAAFPDRSAASVATKMSSLGLRLQDQPEYMAQGAIIGDEERTSRLMEMLAKGGKSQEQMAQELGVSERTVRRYMTNELDVRASRGPGLDDPERMATLKDLAGRGWSQEQIAGKLRTNVGTVSKQLGKLRESGELPDYIPEGGTRTPSMPQYKSLAGEAPAPDPEFEKLQRQYLKGLGYAGMGGIMFTPVDHDPFASQ